MAEKTELSGQHLDEIDRVLMLLGAGIPLTLLLDLATPIHSVDVYHAELGAADWLASVVA
jgi:hypothetical protein